MSQTNSPVIPRVAGLAEVKANGGKFPARSVDAFASRTVYVSSISGVVLDCVLDTGRTAGSGTPTDNAAAINAVLATATPSNPLHLVIDGGAAIGSPLIIPAAGHVAITGHGWSTGFFVLGGSNSTAIQNFAHTNLAEYLIWNPRTPPQTLAGKNVTLSNFRIVGNRGSYTLAGTTGNANGAIDHTLDAYSPTGLQLTPTYSPDARGSYNTAYWLSGVALVGVENLALDRLWIYDAPTYAVSLYHCQKVRVSGCRLEAADPTVLGNTDGPHFNGGCSDVAIEGCWLRTGDDAIAFNLDEGDRVAGSNLVARNITLSGCLAAARVHGQTVGTDRVTLSDFRGAVQWYGLIVGNGTGTGATDLNGSILMDKWVVDVTAPAGGGGLAFLKASVGMLELRSVKAIAPTAAHTLVQLGQDLTGPTVSTLRVADCEVHRNASGSAAVTLLAGVSGTVSNLVIAGFSATDNGSFSAIPYLINLTGSASVARVRIESLDAAHFTAFTNDFSKIGSVGGPGVAACGFAFPDSVIAPGTTYRSSTQSALCYKDPGGAVHVIGLTSPSVVTLMDDTFSGTAGTSVTGRTPDTVAYSGQAYSGPILGGGILALAAGGGATSSGAGSGWNEVYPLTGGPTDYTVTCRFKITNPGVVPLLYLRADTAPNNLIAIAVDYVSQRLVVGKLVAGTFTDNLYTPAATLATGTTYTLAATVAGSTVALSLDGVQVLAPSAIPAAVGPGVAIRQQAGAAGDMTVFRLTVAT